MSISASLLWGAFLPAGSGAPARRAERQDAGATPTIASRTAPATAEAAPDGILVRYRPGTSRQERAEVRRDADVEKVEGGALPRLEVVTTGDAPVDETIEAIEDDPAVAYAEPNLPRSISLKPIDELFSEQYALHNTGQLIGNSVRGKIDADIDAPEAWDITTGSPSVKVAVIDTGVEHTHPDLVGNVSLGPDLVNDDGDPMDDDGHGTHVAGTIGAQGNNTEGVTGIAWNVDVMAIKVLGADGSGYVSDVVKGIEWARANGARIVNLSLGSDTSSRSEKAAMEAASDVLFVVASGNDGLDTNSNGSYPCNYELANIICVAATTWNDSLASYSNFGTQHVDLAAPGSGILSTYLDGSYDFLFGTSMATPHVAGVAALLRSIDPNATPAEMKEAIITGADVLPALEGRLANPVRLNAFGAVSALLATGGGGVPPPQPEPEPTVPPVEEGETHEMGLEVSFKGHLKVVGQMTALDGYLPCTRNAPIHVYRMRSGQAVFIKERVTDSDGRFSIPIKDRKGRYLVFSPAGFVSDLHRCAEVTSGVIKHRH